MKRIINILGVSALVLALLSGLLLIAKEKSLEDLAKLVDQTGRLLLYGSYVLAAIAALLLTSRVKNEE